MRAVSAATRKSAARAMAAPAPATVPFSEATIGWGSARMARMRSQVRRVNSQQPGAVAVQQLADDLLHVAARAERAAACR